MIIYVTNRKLCRGDFFQRMEQLAAGRPNGIILREKDLSLSEYETIAAKAKKICEKYGVRLVVNQFATAAAKLKIPHIQLPMETLRNYRAFLKNFSSVGASVHSIEEAVEAEKLGATWLMAGHIFSTASKKNIPPRGLSFLKQVCQHTNLPVLAIGGITLSNARDLLLAGAKGVCLMSEPMTCSDPIKYTEQLRSRLSTAESGPEGCGGYHHRREETHG